MSYSSSSATVMTVFAFAFIFDVGSSAHLSAPAVYPDLWVSDMFYRALANFTVSDVGNSVCHQQTEMYERNLRNHTSWAVRMAESWIRHPVGIISGNRYQLGMYDECVHVKHPVRGKYCISEVKLLPPTGKDYSFDRTDDLDDFGNNHAWHTILGWGNYDDRVPRNVLKLGMCIPDSCTALDLQTSLRRELEKVFDPEQARISVKVDPVLCTVDEDTYPFNTAFYVTSGFFLLLVLFCSAVTLRHIVTLTVEQNTEEVNRKYNSIIGSFSFVTSTLELIKYDKNNELNALNGIKAAMMLLFLYGHRFMILVGSPISNPKVYEDIYINGPFSLLTNSYIVDPFFFLSGFLMYLTIAPAFRKPGSVWIKLTSPIIYRIARMLPAYCAVIAITAHIMPHLGDGPFWPQKIWHEAEKCKNYWWANLLFINNFVDVKYQCLLMSWYISCDIQFFIIGIIILYIYIKNEKLGVRLLTITFIITIIIPFAVVYFTKVEGFLRVNFPFMEDPRSSASFNKLYRHGHMRAIPFFTGFGCILIIEKLKEKKFKFSKLIVYGGTLVVYQICMQSQIYGILFYRKDRPYYPLEQALYSSLSHFSWTGVMFWFTLVLYTTGYGVLTKILSNRLVVTMGKLSYSVLLVNLTVMLISQSSCRLTTHSSYEVLRDLWLHDSLKSYLMAALLYMTVEAPFGNIVKIIFGRGPKKDSLKEN